MLHIKKFFKRPWFETADQGCFSLCSQQKIVGFMETRQREFSNMMTAEEASSFNQALFSDERKNNLQVGDLFPAVLLLSHRLVDRPANRCIFCNY
jgi:hypothetical protein